MIFNKGDLIQYYYLPLSWEEKYQKENYIIWSMLVTEANKRSFKACMLFTDLRRNEELYNNIESLYRWKKPARVVCYASQLAIQSDSWPRAVMFCKIMFSNERKTILGFYHEDFTKHMLSQEYRHGNKRGWTLSGRVHIIKAYAPEEESNV